MRVRTIRKHSNAFGPVYHKRVGRKYDVPEFAGRNLIAVGLVVEDKPEQVADELDPQD